MKRILIAYATMTGNTSTVAETLLEHLDSKQTGNQIKLIDLAELAPADLLNYDLIIMGSSTWDDGNVNQIAREFLDRLQSEKPDISKLQFAFYGLGDSFYPDFCKAPEILKTQIAEFGSKILGNQLQLDGFPDENALQTAKDWIDTIV